LIEIDLKDIYVFKNSHIKREEVILAKERSPPMNSANFIPLDFQCPEIPLPSS